MILFQGPSKKKQFNSIYHTTHGKLYNAFLKLTGDEAFVKDILQQCYMKLWENWEQIADKEDVYPLLFTYARNIFIDELRRKKSRQAMLQHLRGHTEENAGSEEERYMLKECLMAVHKAISHMPARRKEVYRLSMEEGLSRRGIADLLSLSPNTIDCHLQEALKTLRKAINQSEPELL